MSGARQVHPVCWADWNCPRKVDISLLTPRSGTQAGREHDLTAGVNWHLNAHTNPMVNDAYTAIDYVDDTSGTPLFSRFFGSPRVRPLFRQSHDWNAGGYLPLLGFWSQIVSSASPARKRVMHRQNVTRLRFGLVFVVFSSRSIRSATTRESTRSSDCSVCFAIEWKRP